MSTLSGLIRRALPQAIPFLWRIKGSLLAMGYAGNRCYCPICDRWFNSFLPAGDPRRQRDNARCPRCDSLERHRLLWLFLQRETDFFKQKHRVLHFAPEHCFNKQLNRLNSIEYITADLDASRAKIHMDITNIIFPDGYFDYIFCLHVLEHVPDDAKAMSELCRVIKPDGKVIIMVPMSGIVTLEGEASDSVETRIERFGQADHVRLYGVDITERLERSGFAVTAISYTERLSDDLIGCSHLVMDHSWYDTRELIFVCSRQSQ